MRHPDLQSAQETLKEGEAMPRPYHAHQTVEIYTRLRHPELQSAQETLKGFENSLGIA